MTCELGDIITFQRGHDLPRKSMIKGMYPVIGSNGIIGYHNEYTTEAPTITIGRSGNVGNPAIYYGNAWAHNTTLYVKEFKNSDPIFVYYLLKTLNLANYAGGSAVPTLNRNHIHTLPIRIPQEIDVQRKMGSVLKLFDDKILFNKKINDNLFGQMQALYKSWFVDFLPFGGTKPRTWIETDIYTLANIIYGAPFKSKQFNTDGNGTPIIRIRDLKDQQLTTYTTEVHPKGYLLQPGDIVVGMDGEFRPYIWGNDGAWLNQRVCVFENKRPNGKAFLYFTIKPLLYGIEQTQVATTVIHIGKKDFDAFEITLPDASALDDFDALTAPMIGAIVSNNIENKRLAALRDSLLPKLMSGEIDVSDIQI